MNKERAQFYLRRRIKELEELGAEPDSVSMATARMTYGERLDRHELAAKVREDRAGELNALRDALVYVNISEKGEVQDILNAVYIGAVAECEGAEHKGAYSGNGHHMAQRIVVLVEAELARRGWK